MGSPHDPACAGPRPLRVRTADASPRPRPAHDMSRSDTGVVVSEPFRLQGEHLAIDLPGARAMFTTRRGGFSSGPYESLNLGRWTDDDAAAVERNRQSLQR